MKTSAKREQNRIRQQRQKWINFAIGGGIIVLVLGVLGIIIWQGVKLPVGETVSIPAGYNAHVEIGTALTYPSNPPAGGLHYAQDLESGFYDEAILPNYPGEAVGYLVHSLEHGYVIFWYNCAKLDESACNNLKSQIKAVMQAKNNVKLIAFPWESLDGTLAMTSWGQLQRFKQFDPQLATAFIEGNLNRAPEGNVP